MLENPLLHVLNDRISVPTEETDTADALEHDLSRKRRLDVGLLVLCRELRLERPLRADACERRFSSDGGRETESRSYPSFSAIRRACSMLIRPDLGDPMVDFDSGLECLSFGLGDSGPFEDVIERIECRD